MKIRTCLMGLAFAAFAGGIAAAQTAEKHKAGGAPARDPAAVLGTWQSVPHEAKAPASRASAAKARQARARAVEARRKRIAAAAKSGATKARPVKARTAKARPPKAGKAVAAKPQRNPAPAAAASPEPPATGAAAKARELSRRIGILAPGAKLGEAMADPDNPPWRRRVEGRLGPDGRALSMPLDESGRAGFVARGYHEDPSWYRANGSTGATFGVRTKF